MHIRINRDDVKWYLANNSPILVEQITTVDRRTVMGKIGRVSGQSKVSPFALMPLDIDTTNGLMHTLFSLEDRYGWTVAEDKGKINLVLPESNLGLHATLEQALFDWLQQKTKWDSGVITKDEYDEWRYNYPEDNIKERA